MIKESEEHKPLLRWDILWRWALASFIGLAVASIVFHILPHNFRYPLEDENIWLEQPWRIAVLNFVLYTPISLAQWIILRLFVRRAWWWLFVTLGSVVIVYPGIIWILWTLKLDDPAWFVWFLGLGGSSVYIVAQWIALLRWARSAWIWGIGIVVAAIGGFVVLNIITTISAALTQLLGDIELIDQLLIVAGSCLYQIILGGILAMFLQVASRNAMTQTTMGSNYGRYNAPGE